MLKTVRTTDCLVVAFSLSIVGCARNLPELPEDITYIPEPVISTVTPPISVPAVVVPDAQVGESARPVVVPDAAVRGPDALPLVLPDAAVRGPDTLPLVLPDAAVRGPDAFPLEPGAVVRGPDALPLVVPDAAARGVDAPSLVVPDAAVRGPDVSAAVVPDAVVRSPDVTAEVVLDPVPGPDVTAEVVLDPVPGPDVPAAVVPNPVVSDPVVSTAPNSEVTFITSRIQTAPTATPTPTPTPTPTERVADSESELPLEFIAKDLVQALSFISGVNPSVTSIRTAPSGSLFDDLVKKSMQQLGYRFDDPLGGPGSQQLTTSYLERNKELQTSELIAIMALDGVMIRRTYIIKGDSAEPRTAYIIRDVESEAVDLNDQIRLP